MKKPILITGSHRSGSTWTGYVLSKAQNVRYVHEPFNIGLSNRDHTPILHWFHYVRLNKPGNSDRIKSYIESFYSPFNVTNIKRVFNKKYYSSPYNFLADLKGRLTDRTIIKDPIAIFSAIWFYKELQADVVILIRHPAAFVASLKVKNWKFDFNELIKQPELLNSFPQEYAIQIEKFSKTKTDILEQGILLWNLIHLRILEYKKEFQNEWYFVKHEDLSKDPNKEFKKLCSFLGLNTTEEMFEYIKETTQNQQQNEIQRDSKTNIHSWKNRLSKEEIEIIKNSTSSVWNFFYSESDW